ncbi:hypothetical protein [Actinoplanes subtropicus]|uniref:hypothetical protein n=1 Tax=Actinoplanes subtropicus TaxID=543632 RepID=UPI0012FBB0B4|nr:hypothetical protein [Actinoplanes subtropicus]
MRTTMRMDREPRESGEVVESRHLTDRAGATTARLIGGVPPPADGPAGRLWTTATARWSCRSC